METKLATANSLARIEKYARDYFCAAVTVDPDTLALNHPNPSFDLNAKGFFVRMHRGGFVLGVTR